MADQRSPAFMSEDQVLAGAQFYARAYLSRGVCGVIPAWDEDADKRVWQETPQERRDEYLDMVRGIAVAAFFEAHKTRAAARAIKILNGAVITPTPELMARATQAVLGIIGMDDRVGARQAVVSPTTQQMAADIARAVIEAIRP